MLNFAGKSQIRTELAKAEKGLRGAEEICWEQVLTFKLLNVADVLCLCNLFFIAVNFRKL